MGLGTTRHILASDGVRYFVMGDASLMHAFVSAGLSDREATAVCEALRYVRRRIGPGWNKFTTTAMFGSLYIIVSSWVPFDWLTSTETSLGVVALFASIMLTFVLLDRRSFHLCLATLMCLAGDALLTASFYSRRPIEQQPTKAGTRIDLKHLARDYQARAGMLLAVRKTAWQIALEMEYLTTGMRSTTPDVKNEFSRALHAFAINPLVQGRSEEAVRACVELIKVLCAGRSNQLYTYRFGTTAPELPQSKHLPERVGKLLAAPAIVAVISGIIALVTKLYFDSPGS